MIGWLLSPLGRYVAAAVALVAVAGLVWGLGYRAAEQDREAEAARDALDTHGRIDDAPLSRGIPADDALWLLERGQR